MMDKQFANITKKIITNLPFWFNIKKDPNNSIGALFLDVFGVTLEEVKGVLDYAYKQTNLLTADITMIDTVYKGVVPQVVVQNIETIQITGEGYVLKRVNTVEDFFVRAYEDMNHPLTDPGDVFYIDTESYMIYTLKPYKKSLFDHSSILTVIIDDKQFIDIPLLTHMVWNYFDEFGYLLGCPRIHGEKNSEYKERILDVFVNKPGASMDQLLNGISRELGLTKKTEWDGKNPLELKDPMIVVNKIKLDEYYAGIQNVELTPNNTVVLKERYMDGSVLVSYNAGIEMHRLNNKKDYTLQRQLYNANGTATELLKNYAKTIKTMVPIMWNQFKFNEAYWDIADENMSGFGALPHISDASIEGFRWFTKDNPRNTIAPKLMELLVNDMEITIEESSVEFKTIFSPILKAVNTHPKEIEAKGGEIIELSYHGSNG